MKGLANLIRVHKWKLDEKRRELSDMESLRYEFYAQLDQLAQSQEQEQEIAAEFPEISFTYAGFANANRLRRENLEGSVSEIEEKISLLNEEVAECFQELKKYEIVADLRDKQWRQKQLKTEQQEIDDLAIEQFRRQS
ncbi:MAG: flagellar FliJ family protein [Proteobacteria bacterium]|nr:flagellar FliJ family protein [Pseudomonadota bacterium]